MRDFYRQFAEELKAGKKAVYCCVLATFGSTPAGPGSTMAVLADGRIIGTVGGGALEMEAVKTALELMDARLCKIREFELGREFSEDAEMACGGRAMVYFRPVHPEEKDVLSVMERAEASVLGAEKSWLLCELNTGLFDIYRSESLDFSRFCLPEKVLARLNTKPVLVPGEKSYFTQPLSGGGRVFLFGGGHVGKALCRVLSFADFPVVVLDDRAEIAVREDFPQAEDVLLCDYEKVPEKAKIGPMDWVVVMTHGHRADIKVLEQVLKTEACYIGCMGSKNKTRVMMDSLRKAGFSEEDVARIKAPIGLPIGSKTPAEVAISVAAQLIEIRSGKRA